MDAAVAAKAAAQRQIDVLQAQVLSGEAQLKQGRAQRATAQANLTRTQLHATIDGRVTKLSAAVARNLGGSMGVSLAQTTLARREQFHQSRLVEHVGSWNPAYGETLQQVQNYFATKPLVGVGAGAYRTAIAWIGQQVQVQASFWAYIDVFFCSCLSV